jgi:prophage antirepressor-like protein
MMNVGVELLRKQFQGVALRVHGTFENPLYCAQDVQTALGLGNIRDNLTKLDEDEKIKHTFVSESPTGRNYSRKMVFVTESGLYKLIFWCNRAKRSGTPAYRFLNWVVKRVIPGIRKDGGYRLTQAIQQKDQVIQQKDQTIKFLHDNRYHYFGRVVCLRRGMIPDAIYNFLNRQSTAVGCYLTWNGNVPYVRRGREQQVRQHLERNIPRTQNNGLGNYGFLDD